MNNQDTLRDILSFIGTISELNSIKLISKEFNNVIDNNVITKINNRIDFNNYPNLQVINVCNMNLKNNLDVSKIYTLRKLDCEYNNITSLELPKNLQILECDGNQLTELNLPENLKILNCFSNQLTSLNLPGNLQILSCDYNKLTSLNLPENLQTLDCSNNQLTELNLNCNKNLSCYSDINVIIK